MECISGLGKWPYAYKLGQKFLHLPCFDAQKGCLGPKMTKTQNLCSRCISSEKASWSILNARNAPKRPWGWYLRPTGTLQNTGLKPKNFSIFTPEPASKNYVLCHMGAHTTHKPFFLKFSVALMKIEYFSYHYHLWVIETRQAVLR